MQQSQAASTEIDLSRVFREIFTRNIIHIAFGEDVSDQEIEIWNGQDFGSGAPIELTKMKFCHAIEAVTYQLTT